MPNVPYPYEVNGKLVTENGSLIPICSLSNSSLLPSLTVSSQNNVRKYRTKVHEQVFGFQLVSYEKTTLEHTLGAWKRGGGGGLTLKVAWHLPLI